MSNGSGGIYMEEFWIVSVSLETWDSDFFISIDSTDEGNSLSMHLDQVYYLKFEVKHL